MAGERDPLQERIHRRAERKRQLRRRRRATAAAAGLALLAGIGVLATSSLSDGPERERPKAQQRSVSGTAEGEAEEPEKATGPCEGGKYVVATGPADEDVRPVPILMYHEIGDPPADAALPELFVEPDDLKRQVRWLGKQGYTAITLDQLAAGWSPKGPALPRKPIVISFDDGLLGQYVHALPTLRKAGWPGVLNLKVESLEQRELTKKMVCEMLAHGWELSSHTLTHPDVTTLEGDALEAEIRDSRFLLRRRFEVPVRHFSYPGGRVDAAAVEAVRAAGYSGAVGTQPGLASPATPFEQPRIRVERSDGLSGLQQSLQAWE